uniref:Metaxin n=1 Tax=Steinernema glaseri TaxID=37863 RepID=A0A1I8A5T0_9BILA
MDLQVWPSDFCLPSIDADCLQFMACAKFCAAPINIVSSLAPWKAVKGEFPVFTNGDDTITNISDFIEFLRNSSQDVVLDGDISESERCSFDAFHSLLRKTLYPAQLQFLWVDKSNYATVTHQWYSSKLPFPYNMFYMERKRRKAQQYISAYGRKENQILTDAIQMINLLSAKLGDNKYFCGDKPSSLDALIFGYLAPFLKLPMPSDRLSLHLSACSNLVRFVESIISIYLPLSESDLRAYDKSWWLQRKIKAQKDDEFRRTHKEKKETETDEDGASTSLRDTIIFAVGALTLSCIFVVHTGIVQFAVSNGDDDNGDDMD